MDEQEKAFTVAAIKVKIEADKKEKKRIEGFLKKDEKTNQVTISQKELPKRKVGDPHGYNQNSD